MKRNQHRDRKFLVNESTDRKNSENLSFGRSSLSIDLDSLERMDIETNLADSKGFPLLDGFSKLIQFIASSLKVEFFVDFWKVFKTHLI